MTKAGSHPTSKTAEERFSDDGLAKRWSDMYASETMSLYESNFRRRRDVTVQRVQALLPPGGRVVDLGCGAAPVVAELRARDIPCVGLDYSNDMLDYGRERLRELGLPDGDLYQGDCVKTPFEDHAFDIVLSLGVISYVDNVADAFREIRRVLKPGGYAIVSYRSRRGQLSWDPVRGAKNVLGNLAGRAHKVPSGRGKRLDPRFVREQAISNGFDTVEFVGIGFGPLRFHGKSAMSEARSLRLSNSLAARFERLGWKWPYEWLADIHLHVYREAG